jgi:hypothetical protein
LARREQVITMRSGNLRYYGLAVLAGASLSLAGCSQQTETPPVPPASNFPATTTSAPDSTTVTGQPVSGKPAQQTTTSTHASSQTTSTPAATVTISVVKQPTCPVHGTPDAPFSSPGTDAVISWKVTGANGAAIAVDNPNIYGAYGMYGATGQLSLAFGCDTTPGKTTHTYTVWPAGIKNVSKTISVSATNNP